MLLIENILKDERYIELMRLKDENRALISKWRDNRYYYKKLTVSGLQRLTRKRILTYLKDTEWESYKIGLNKSGIGKYTNTFGWNNKAGYLYPINNLDILKKINWRELGNELNLKDAKKEKYNIIMRSLEDYDTDTPIIKKKVSNTILDYNGEQKSIRELEIDGEFYVLDILEDGYYYLGSQMYDFLILEQLYDDLFEYACEFVDLTKRKNEHNSKVCDKLKEDLSSYFLIDEL